MVELGVPRVTGRRAAPLMGDDRRSLPRHAHLLPQHDCSRDPSRGPPHRRLWHLAPGAHGSGGSQRAAAEPPRLRGQLGQQEAQGRAGSRAAAEPPRFVVSWAARSPRPSRLPRSRRTSTASSFRGGSTAGSDRRSSVTLSAPPPCRRGAFASASVRGSGRRAAPGQPSEAHAQRQHPQRHVPEQRDQRAGTRPRGSRSPVHRARRRRARRPPPVRCQPREPGNRAHRHPCTLVELGAREPRAQGLDAHPCPRDLGAIPRRGAARTPWSPSRSRCRPRSRRRRPRPR
jgi:hypothetical protein